MEREGAIGTEGGGGRLIRRQGGEGGGCGGWGDLVGGGNPRPGAIPNWGRQG